MVLLKWLLNQVLIVLGPLLIDRLIAWNRKRTDQEAEQKLRDEKIDQAIKSYHEKNKGPDVTAKDREKAFEDLINRPK